MTIAKRLFHLAVLPLIATFASSAWAEAFLRIDGIPGDSTAPGFENQIPALQVDLTVGPDACLGPVVAKSVDYATPALVRAAAEETTFNSALISARRAGGSGQQYTYLRLALSQVKVRSVRATGLGGGDAPIETIVLAAESITTEYFVQRNDGTVVLASTSQSQCPRLKN